MEKFGVVLAHANKKCHDPFDATIDECVAYARNTVHGTVRARVNTFTVLVVTNSVYLYTPYTQLLGAQHRKDRMSMEITTRGTERCERSQLHTCPCI